MKKIEMDNVILNFGKTEILKSVYFKAEKKQITGILGSNGSGKTSLLRILFGELKPQSKLIRIDDKPILKPLYTQNNIRFLPQFHIIPSAFSLQKAFNYFNVALDSFLNHFPEFKEQKQIKFKILSGGERRLIETYILLKSKVDLVILDEPFSHLAPLYIQKIKTLIIEEKKNKAIIITDHLFKDILEISDKNYFLKDGWCKLLKNKEDLIFHKYTNAM